jgi:PAS domain S-box-containing protein
MLESSTEQLQKKPVNLTPESLISVLHVDDDADFLKSSKRIMEMQGSFQIETALSVKEALQKLGQKPYDVIVSDYQMPETDGLNFLKELRDRGNDIPFILFTGKGREEVAIEALNLGADRYINKSGNPEAVYGELAYSIKKAVKAKRAEKMLRESEEQYRNIVELSPDGIMTLNLKGTVTSVNKAFVDLTGFSEAEIVGKHFTKLGTLRARDLPKYMKLFASFLRGKIPSITEFLYLRKDGSHRWGEAQFSFIKNEEKKVGIQAILRDITERKRMAEQLKISEEKYHKQFETAMDAIFLADAETGILLDCNHAATELVGRKKSELIGKHQRILHPPEETEGEFSRTFRQHLKEKEGQVLETQVITKTGEIRDVAIKANIFELGNKKLFQCIFRDVTDKKKMEEQLRREQETIELVTENIGAGLTIISKDYRILWANKFLKNACGDVKGKTCYSVYNDRTSICPGCGVKEIFETGKNHVVHEQPVPGPDGQRVWIEITANPIRDEKGNIVAASELSVYVNERKQLENRLREAEKRYHALFDKAPLGILMIDSTGIAVDFNEEAHRQLGYSREEFANLTVSDYEVLESSDETRARMKKILKTGKDEFETKHRTKTGEIRDIINTVQVIELSGKKFFQVITRDITEQKKAEEALRESEEKYRELLNGMNDTAWVIDFDCNIIDVNDAAVEVMGYSREELLSIGLTGIDSNLDPKEIKGLVEGMPADEIQLFETVHTTKDGKKIPVEISSSLVTYRGKRAILSIARDITERKKAEEKLDEMMNELVTINEKLGVVGRLTRHDARNKLSVIANNAYLAKQKLAANHSSLEYLGDIESAVDQMEKIFDFARTYEMLGVEELSYMNVEKNVDEAAILFSELATVKFANECKGLTVMADSLLRQLFYNLIDDTLKHGEKASQIRVYYEEGESQLKLIYEDDGVGIPEDEKEKIFNEGYGKGTGYGLYLIKKICETYGWIIQETGVPGKGAQFTMTIPKTDKKGKISYRFDKQ